MISKPDYERGAALHWFEPNSGQIFQRGEPAIHGTLRSTVLSFLELSPDKQARASIMTDEQAAHGIKSMLGPDDIREIAERDDFKS